MPTVLLIDDNALQLRTRATILRHAGFEVCVATTVDSALARLRQDRDQGRLHAVITDHIMPEASGAAFVRALRRVDAAVPVIVVSGMAEAETDYRGLNVIFRQKPLPPKELIALVRSVAAG